MLKWKNIHFYIRQEKEKVDSGEKIIYKLLIINDYNLENIDLNKSNINRKPANFLYSFTQVSFGNYNHEQFTEVLNDFVGSPRDYKNPLLFDINTYLEAKKINLEFRQQIKFIKFSEHFFTYYLDYIISDMYIECIDFIFIFLGVLIEGIFIFYSVYTITFIFEEENRIKMVLIFMMINALFILIMIIFYKCIKSIKKNIIRIDCIYSKSFDRIFIGLVRYSQSRYLNTFEYQMNNINRFIYEKVGINNHINFHLKVIFKNKEIQQICILEEQSENELEGLILLLNEKLIINTDNNFDSNELV